MSSFRVGSCPGTKKKGLHKGIHLESHLARGKTDPPREQTFSSLRLQVFFALWGGGDCLHGIYHPGM